MDTQPTRLQQILQWASLPHIRAVGIAIVVLAVLAILQVQTMDRPTPMCELLEGCRLQSADVQRLQVAFGQAGLSEFEIKGHSFLVPSEQHKKYMQVATEQRAIPANLLPQESQAPTLNPFMTRAQQRAVELNNKKQEVRSMVELLPFVDQAWFEMDRSESGNAFRPARQTAVISIRSIPDVILTDRHMESIKRMISAAVADLPTENIVVVDLNDGLAHQELFDASTERQIQAQRISYNQQRFYETQIREALSEYPDLKIRVSVDVEEVEETVEDKVAFAHVPEPTLPQAGANGRITIQAEPAPPKMPDVKLVAYSKPVFRINVAVDVPEATLFQVFGKPEVDANRHRSAKARELAMKQEMLTRFNQFRRQITQRIESSLPTSDSAEANQIAVNLIKAPQAEPAASGWQTAWNLLQRQWPSVAVVALGLVLLTIVTRNPVVEETVSTPPPVDPDVLDINSHHSTDAEVRLSQMIEEDPDAAARIIETWIRDAA